GEPPIPPPRVGATIEMGVGEVAIRHVGDLDGAPIFRAPDGWIAHAGCSVRGWMETASQRSLRISSVAILRAFFLLGASMVSSCTGVRARLVSFQNAMLNRIVIPSFRIVRLC